jgi:hypothetical protein
MKCIDYLLCWMSVLVMQPPTWQPWRQIKHSMQTTDLKTRLDGASVMHKWSQWQPYANMCQQSTYVQRSHLGKFRVRGFFQSAMFLASVLKRGHHPPENLLKFNVPGGWMPLFTRLASYMTASYFGKNYLTVFPQKWDFCMWVLWYILVWPP